MSELLAPLIAGGGHCLRFVREGEGRRPWTSTFEPYWHLGANPTADVVALRRHPIRREREVLLIRRDDEAPAEPGKWALPGGFVRTEASRNTEWTSGAETSREAALRELHEETGLDVMDLEAQLVEIGTYQGQGRDPRDTEQAWSKSCVFALDLPDDRAGGLIAGGDDACDARWISITALPWNLAFDHERILADALAKMRATRRLRLGALELDDQ